VLIFKAVVEAKLTTTKLATRGRNLDTLFGHALGPVFLQVYHL
jgi:hypothetical protein